MGKSFNYVDEWGPCKDLPATSAKLWYSLFSLCCLPCTMKIPFCPSKPLIEPALSWKLGWSLPRSLSLSNNFNKTVSFISELGRGQISHLLSFAPLTCSHFHTAESISFYSTNFVCLSFSKWKTSVFFSCYHLLCLALWS